MFDLIRLLIASLPLVIAPLAMGSVLLQAAGMRKLPLPAKWWLGMLVAGIFVLIAHGLNLGAWPVIGTLSLAAIGSIVKWGGDLKQNQIRIEKKLFWDSLPCYAPFVFFAALIFILYLDILANPIHPLHLDALAIWYQKVIALFHWIPFQSVAAPHSPHLGPVLQMLAIRFSGDFSEAYGRLIFPTIYFFSFCSLNILVPQIQAKARWGIPLAGIIFFHRTSVTYGYQDVLLASGILFSAVYFVKILLDLQTQTYESDDRPFYHYYFLAVFFAAALSLIKTEGTVMSILLFGISTFIFLIFHFRFFVSRWTRLTPVWAAFFIILGIWPALLWFNRIDLSNLPDVPQWQQMFQPYHFDRWTLISEFFAKSLAERFPLLLSLIFLSSLAGIWIPRLRAILAFLWAVLLLHLALIPIPYLVSQAPLPAVLRGSLNHLVFQTSFLYALILCVSCWNLLAQLAEYPAHQISGISERAWTQFLLVLMALIPLLWLWPRFTNPSFSMVDDPSDLSYLSDMKANFGQWLWFKGFHGEPEGGRLRTMYWIMRFFFYFLPAGFHALGWIIIHYLNLVLAIGLMFVSVKAITGKTLTATLASLLWIFDRSTVENYVRLATQEIWQVLWLGCLILMVHTFFQQTQTKNKKILAAGIIFATFALYFSKETSVVMLPFSLMMAAGAFLYKRGAKEWGAYAGLNVGLFGLQRLFSPPVVGYTTQFKLSAATVMTNFKGYFLELQWHYLFVALLISYLVRLYLKRQALREAALEHWQSGLFILGAGFFTIFLPWGEHVNRYLLVTSYLFSIFMALELQHYFYLVQPLPHIAWPLIGILASSSSGLMPATIRYVYAHAREKNTVDALRWLTRHAEPNANVFLWEFEKEFVYSSLQYIQNFFARRDITVYSLSPFTEEFQRIGLRVVRVRDIDEDVLDRMDYLVWNHDGVTRSDFDDFHQRIFTQLQDTKYAPGLKNVYKELISLGNAYPEGTEIWKFDRGKTP